MNMQRTSAYQVRMINIWSRICKVRSVSPRTPIASLGYRRYYSVTNFIVIDHLLLRSPVRLQTSGLSGYEVVGTPPSPCPSALLPSVQERFDWAMNTLGTQIRELENDQCGESEGGQATKRMVPKASRLDESNPEPLTPWP